MRVRDRGKHPPGHPRRVVAQLAVHRADHQVQPGEQLVLLVQRAVVEDVDLDAGEDPEAVRQLLVQLRHVVELAAQAVGGQPVRDLEPRRVVGEHEVLMAEVGRGQRHLLDRGTAVRPVGVHVQVAAQRLPQLPGRGRQVGALGAEQPPQVDRLLAGQGLGHAAGGHLADAGQFRQRAGRGALDQLVVRGPGHGRGRRPEGPHPIRRLVRPLQQERDAPQVRDRVTRCHAPTLATAPTEKIKIRLGGTGVCRLPAQDSRRYLSCAEGEEPRCRTRSTSRRRSSRPSRRPARPFSASCRTPWSTAVPPT